MGVPLICGITGPEPCPAGVRVRTCSDAGRSPPARPASCSVWTESPLPGAPPNLPRSCQSVEQHVDPRCRALLLGTLDHEEPPAVGRDIVRKARYVDERSLEEWLRQARRETVSDSDGNDLPLRAEPVEQLA